MTGSVFTNASPTAQHLYRSLLTALRPIGAFQEELKKTSVHLVRGSAFVGVQLRREYLIVTIQVREADQVGTDHQGRAGLTKSLALVRCESQATRTSTGSCWPGWKAACGLVPMQPLRLTR